MKIALFPLKKEPEKIENLEDIPEENEKKNEKTIKKLIFPTSFLWKTDKKPTIDRLGLKIAGLITSGAGCTVALLTTYYNYDIRIRAQCYIITGTVFILLDPLGIFKRFLAIPSRALITALNILLLSCIVSNDSNLWKVYIICAITCGALIFILNDYLLKAENWKMCDAVDHAINGDPDNRAGESWKADGRRTARTVLYTLGYTVKDADLDTFIKAVYSVGFWNCYNRQQDQADEIETLNDKIDEWQGVVRSKNKIIEDMDDARSNVEILGRRIQSQAQEIKDLKEMYNDAVIKNRKLYNLYKNLEAQKTVYVEIREEPEEMEQPIKNTPGAEMVRQEIQEPDQMDEGPGAGNLLKMPRGVTQDKYAEICELLKAGKKKTYIEAVTGISKYKVTLCEKIMQQRKIYIN